jgi:isopentenyldiphosphate isomerase
MSMMRELTFFLGIQVKQTKQDNFVHQVKYTNDLIKKFNMTELKSVSTPMSSAVSLGPDKDGEAVDQREYMSMISSLLYLMRLCTRFQTSPHSSHRMTVQRIFRYLKHS